MIKFLDALAKGMPKNERLIFCGFVGDPNSAPPNAWRPMSWQPGDNVPINPQHSNGYITVSSFRRAPDKSWRRRTDLFGHGLAIMVDDVGTKVERSVVESIAPSAIIETSPGNEQWWYFLEATDDKLMFDAVIKAFIRQALLGSDPGMNGVNRVGRIPGFINGKAIHEGWRVKLLHLCSLRYELSEIKDLFGLSLAPVRRRRRYAPTDAKDRVALFMTHYNWLVDRGQLKHDRPNAGGWIEMHCPWRDEHTGRADTGAAIAQPSEENEWYGGFQCHHGHCIDRGWSSLTEWMTDINAQELEVINEHAQEK